MANLPDLMRSNRSLFSEFFRDLDDLFFTGYPVAQAQAPRANFVQPKMEVEEDEKNYVLSFDVPGVPKDELKIEVVDNVLTISGARRSASANRSESYTFQRSLSLPTGITADHVQANYEHGVLDIVIPKERVQERRSIAIGQGRGQTAISADEKKSH